MDAAAWTAVGTFLVVIATLILARVTWKLWTNGQSQLDEARSQAAEQRRVTALLNKPRLRIENPELKWFQTLDGKKYGIAFLLRNVGDGSALNVHVAMRATIASTDLEYKNTYDESSIGRSDFFTVQLPTEGLDKAGERPGVEMVVEITFDDISAPRNRMSYITRQIPSTGEWAITHRATSTSP